MMRRRDFMLALAGAAAAWPLAARAQQREPMRRVGVLMNLAVGDPEGEARSAAFLQALQQLGWSDGRNVRIDYRWAAGRRRSLSQIRRGTAGARAGRYFGFGHPKRSSTAAGDPHGAYRVRYCLRPGRRGFR